MKALLNLPEESRMEETTDEEICQAVLGVRDSQKEGALDGDVDGDGVVEPCPTYREVCEATSIINRYVEHIDDPIAHKFEVMLASIGRQIRLERAQALTITHITDYFNHTEVVLD